MKKEGSMTSIQAKFKTCFKVVSTIICITFMAQMIAWSYPVSIESDNYNLAVPVAFSQVPMTDFGADLKEGVVKNASFLTSILYIAEYLLGEDLPLDYLENSCGK